MLGTWNRLIALTVAKWSDGPRSVVVGLPRQIRTAFTDLNIKTSAYTFTGTDTWCRKTCIKTGG
jgi:hypothetical protein